MEKVIAACGNDCAACPRYTAHPFEKTEEELRHTAELWYRIGYRDHIVTNEEIACNGCKPENWCRYRVIKCCIDREIKTCGECEEYPCANMKECFEVTKSFEPGCRQVCTEEEYALLKKAFFEKEKNLKNMNQTIRYYNKNAEDFISGTITADMRDAYTEFLNLLPQNAYILDFGCGSGRDTAAFLDRGYRVDAADGSEELCRKASELTGIPVKHMLFQELEAESLYDGIWACASILHLPQDELKEVLYRIAGALKQEGILYTSFKYGSFQGERGGRYFTDFTEDSLQIFWKDISALEIIKTWITADVRPGREEEQWINILARRT